MVAAPSQLAYRPPRDARLAPYLQNQAMWGVLTVLGGGLPYAGDEPNPRPLPQTTLYDFKRRVAASAPSGQGPVPDALYFAFYSDKYRVAPEKAITVPAEHLWWLAASQDTVLLSDRRTHHYTEIAEVDREQERISFHDLWPDNFFLLPGRNTLGIAARRDPGLSISKAEFLRVVTGLVTWDTPRLVQHYFAAFRDRRGDRDALVRFGFALLDAEADELAPMAADLFAEAARLAAAAGSREDAERAAQQAYLAATCGAYRAASGGNRAALAAMQAVLQTVIAAYGRPALEAGLLPRELARLGNAAGHARDFKQARAVLDLAVAKDTAFEDGYWLRASAALQDGEPAGAAADAERALELNDAELAKLAAERAAIDPRGRWELQWKDGQIGGRRARRASELAVLLNARLGLGDFARARAAAAALVDLQPGKPLGHLKLALVEQAAGDRAAAAAALSTAIAVEPDASQRASYEKLLAELAQPGPA